MIGSTLIATMVVTTGLAVAGFGIFSLLRDRRREPAIDEAALLEALVASRIGLSVPLLVAMAWDNPDRPMRLCRRVERVLEDMERRGLVESHTHLSTGPNMIWWRAVETTTSQLAKLSAELGVKYRTDAAGNSLPPRPYHDHGLRRGAEQPPSP